MVIGGVGGRLAMFALRVTSDPALRGLKTDDDFVIGRFSGDTTFLIFVTAFLGVAGGLFYLAVRPWIPPRLRAWAMALFGGIVGGSLFIDPHGSDFTRLEPLSLAVVMFVALPALYGLTMSTLVERFLKEDSVLQRSRAWVVGLIPLLPIMVLGVTGLALLAILGALWAISRAAPRAASLWSSTPVVWTGRSVLVGGTGFALAGLVDDISQIL